jgi:hypothetical protein
MTTASSVTYKPSGISTKKKNATTAQGIMLITKEYALN